MKTIYTAVGGPRQGVRATMNLYLQEISEKFAWKKRPLVIVVPGGGYAYTSDREADPIAMQFLSFGYHVAILRYSCKDTRYPDALLQLATAHVYIRRHADEFGIDENKIFSCGFSAGGHLVGSYCERWSADFVRDTLNDDLDKNFKKNEKRVEKSELKPNGMILGYPVITSGEYAHKGSFENLIGMESDFEDLDEYKAKMDEVSLEKHVNKDVPPTFIWGTYEDKSVHPMNSILMVEALMSKGISVEYHLFSKGGHGLSLGDYRTMSPGKEDKELVPSVTPWIDMAHTWIEEM